MGRVELTPIDEVKQPVAVDIRHAVPIYSELLRKGVIEKPIIVEEESGVALSDFDLLEALNLLGVDMAPTIALDRSEFEISSTCGRPISLEDIVNAGTGGSKLGYGSFQVKLRFHEPSISVDLDSLGFFNEYKRRSNLRVYNDTLELLYKGWPTPLVRLKSFSSNDRIVLAKLEGFNPFSNSVKDRIGWAMIMEALGRGILREILYEATSTNTGIALASIGNILGLRSRFFIPKTVQRVSDAYLKILGAEVERVPVNLTVEAISEVESKARMDGATHLNQFENDANLKVHLKYTAKEIDLQLREFGVKPDCIIGGLGTSGHMSAISLYFRSKYNGGVKIVGVQPAQDEAIPGIRRVETGMKWVHWFEFDRIVDVRRSEAVEGCIEVARREGLLIGLSSGAVFQAFKKIAKESGVYVLVFPDTGYKYGEQFEEYIRIYGKL
ncbi:MAG: pyridoxal-phosphate dependent enzyme [Candidatus Bathyarchaeia archaeon]|nr:pyridoxal-phosphate dependent enzyme [Candidatus Bathyarchaeota archaeon]